jgi:putative transposase
MGNSSGMKPQPDPHYRHRFPAEIISHAVWLYHVFRLSLRDVELLLAERGVVVSYETVRRWCKKFGQSFANRLRHRRAYALILGHGLLRSWLLTAAMRNGR